MIRINSETKKNMGSYPYEETRHSNSSNFYERFNESDDYEDETPVKKFVNYK